MAIGNTQSRPYVSGGQVLAKPPLIVRIRAFLFEVYAVLGLYFATLFSFDPYGSAQSSSFNADNRKRRPEPRTSSFGSGRGGGGPGGGGGGPGSGPKRPGGPGAGGGGPTKRIGRVDDIRGPECGSCG